MKVKQGIICIGLIACFALQTLAVGFNSTPSRRLESPRLRKESVAQKRDSSNGGYGKSRLNTQSDTTSASKTRRRQTDSSGSGTSLLPEGFDADCAASTKRSSTEGGRKVLSAEGVALKESIKVEYGDGHGETADEALKEAMKDVLQKVVGVYVDSDFRMNNDQIIKDEIITHSNGFIDHYKKMEESDDPSGRGKSVTIKAWVKMRDFVNRMKKIAPRQCVAMDGVLLDNEIDNNVNAETLLRNEFEKFDSVLDLMEIGLVSSIRPEIQSNRDGAIVLRYVFQVRYSRDKYYQFIRRIEPLLDQISTKKTTRTVPFKLVQVSCYPQAENKYWEEQQVQAYYLCVDSNQVSARKLKSEEVISAIKSITRGGAATVREWKVSEHLKRVYDEIMREKYYWKGKCVQCVFSVLDENRQELSRVVQNIERLDVITWPDFMPFINDRNYMTSESSWKCNRILALERISSFLCYADKYIGYIDIMINREDVKKSD